MNLRAPKTMNNVSLRKWEDQYSGSNKVYGSIDIYELNRTGRWMMYRKFFKHAQEYLNKSTLNQPGIWSLLIISMYPFGTTSTWLRLMIKQDAPEVYSINGPKANCPTLTKRLLWNHYHNVEKAREYRRSGSWENQSRDSLPVGVGPEEQEEDLDCAFFRKLCQHADFFRQKAKNLSVKILRGNPLYFSVYLLRIKKAIASLQVQSPDMASDFYDGFNQN